jgi:Arc/MetJ-type ribon-helix-helix transcriptional regulator
LVTVLSPWFPTQILNALGALFFERSNPKLLDLKANEPGLDQTGAVFDGLWCVTRRAPSLRFGPQPIAIPHFPLYGECMARLISTTVRLDEDDVRALKRARAAGHSASELIRKGLRVAASRYYPRRRPPSTRLFESTDTKLGDESELFRDLEG